MSIRKGSGARPANAGTVTGAIKLALGLAALALVPAEVQRDGFARFGDLRSPAFFPILATTSSSASGRASAGFQSTCLNAE